MGLRERFEKLKDYKKKQEEKTIRDIEATNQAITRLEPHVINVCKQFSKATGMKLHIQKQEFKEKIGDKKIKVKCLSLSLEGKGRDGRWRNLIYVYMDRYYSQVSIRPTEDSSFKPMTIPFAKFTDGKLAECLESAYKQIVRLVTYLK